MLSQFNTGIQIIIDIFLFQPYNVGTQKNSLNEMILSSTKKQKQIKLISKKMITSFTYQDLCMIFWLLHKPSHSFTTAIA